MSTSLATCINPIQCVVNSSPIEPELTQKKFIIRLLFNGLPRSRIRELLQHHSAESVYELLNHRIDLNTLKTWKTQLQQTAKHQGRLFELEQRLYQWYLQRITRGEEISVRTIKLEAERLAVTFGRPRWFNISLQWITNFLNKHNPGSKGMIMRVTKSMKAMQGMVYYFYQMYNLCMEGNKYLETWIYNEMVIKLRPKIMHSVDLVLNNKVIYPMGKDVGRVVVSVMVSSTGKMAPPVLIFPSKDFESFVIPGAEDIIITSNYLGKCVEATNYEVVLPHFMKYIEEHSLLIYNESPSHISQRILNLLGTKHIDGMRFPIGSNKVLSPVESCLQKTIRSAVAGSFTSWCLDHFGSLTKQEIECVSNQRLAYWILKACQSINKEEIVKSFNEAGLLNREMQRVVIEEVIPRMFGQGPQKVPDEALVLPRGSKIEYGRSEIKL